MKTTIASYYRLALGSGVIAIFLSNNRLGNDLACLAAHSQSQTITGLRTVYWPEIADEYYELLPTRERIIGCPDLCTITCAHQVQTTYGRSQAITDLLAVYS